MKGLSITKMCTQLNPFTIMVFTLIPTWINNHMPIKIWDEITIPFPNFNDYTVEFWEWISNITPHFKMSVITYSCCVYYISLHIALSPLYPLLILYWLNVNMFPFSVIHPHSNGTGGWNLCSWKTKTHPPHVCRQCRVHSGYGRSQWETMLHCWFSNLRGARASVVLELCFNKMINILQTAFKKAFVKENSISWIKFHWSPIWNQRVTST